MSEQLQNMRDHRHLALCADQLVDCSKFVIAVLDDLIAEHGDMPISDSLAERLVGSIDLLDRAQTAVAIARNEERSHA